MACHAALVAQDSRYQFLEDLLMRYKYPELLLPFKTLPSSYVVVDTESTGLFDEAGAPGCISIGVCVVDSGSIIDAVEYLVRPHRELESSAAALNGFCKERVKKHPTFESQWDEVSKFIEGSLVVMHNAVFDWGLLSDHTERYGLPMPKVDGVFCSQRSANPWADINKLTYSGWGPSLDTLTAYLGLENERALNQAYHGALVDAKQGAYVVEKLRSVAVE